jgi:medium-chain acyl-[acyl-carrier-protein] hydrolase
MRTPESRSPAPSWVARMRPSADAQLRLFCFPFAGGGPSTYRPWSAALPPVVEVCPVQLPGRGGRFNETAFQNAAELVCAAADGLEPFLDRPFALFGHSMGALVAFELARELRRRRWRGPLLLAVSGHHAPHRPDPEPPITHLPDAEFVEALRERYDGIPSEVLAEPELLALVLPALRADVRVLETYAHTEETPLPCPISCFGGEDDRHVPLRELQAWADMTRDACRVRLYPGGHFFLDTAAPALLEALREDLLPWLAATELRA